MYRFRPKPTGIIEAVQLNEELERTALEWFAEAVRDGEIILHWFGKNYLDTGDPVWAEVKTRLGVRRGICGDYIVRNAHGALEVFPEDIFVELYEKAGNKS